MYVKFGFVCGGIFSGSLIAYLVAPFLWQRASLSKRKAAAHGIISFVVFGMGIGGSFAFGNCVVPQQELWASHMIGLAIGFFGMIIILFLMSRSFVSKVLKLPPEHLSALFALLRRGANPTDPQSADHLDEALDKLEGEDAS